LRDLRDRVELRELSEEFGRLGVVGARRLLLAETFSNRAGGVVDSG
jgi:hypothetical protein